MRIDLWRFNLYLSCALCSLLLTGCKTTSERDPEEITSLRVHIETNADPSGRNPTAVVSRQDPVTINIHREPFLDERNVEAAALVDTLGGFAIELKLDRRGTWLLESYTVANRGKRMAIMCQFGDSEETTRWLAAPMIRSTIDNGVLVFTPDASREEAERIVKGLNRLAKEAKKKYTF